MDYQSFIASTGFNEWALLSFALFVKKTGLEEEMAGLDSGIPPLLSG